MKFLVATILLATCLVVQGRYTNIEFDKLYNAISNKNGSRIINGSKAVLGQFPYQASMLMSKSGEIYPNNFCSGALINNIYILTAARCIQGYVKWFVKLGGVRLDGVGESQVAIQSVVAMRHENYNPGFNQNDIGLIQLPKPVQYTDNIKPLRLPSRSDVGYDLNSDIVRLSGWGATQSTLLSNELMYADVSAMSNIECQKYYGSIITSSALCTIGFTGQSACKEDNGDPLTRIAEDGIRTHIGIVNYYDGSPLCNTGKPVIYTRTTSYLDWISQRTGIAIRP